MTLFKAYRLKIGLSVNEVSRSLNISSVYVWKIESGEREPGRKVLIKMAKLYKCKIEDFFCYENKQIV